MKMGERAARAQVTPARTAGRRIAIMTPMKHGGGYDGPTTDALMQLANRPGGLAKAGVTYVGREIGGSTEHARNVCAALAFDRANATDLVFLDSDNAFDVDTWDALLGVDGDVVGVPYLRRVPPHLYTLRFDGETFSAPQVRVDRGERLLTVRGAGTGLLRITRGAWERTAEKHPELRSWSDAHDLHMVSLFSDMLCSEPILQPDKSLRTPPAPYTMFDDFSFCARARNAGCRVEVLLDRVSVHAGVSPETHHPPGSTLAVALGIDTPTRDANET